MFSKNQENSYKFSVKTEETMKFCLNLSSAASFFEDSIFELIQGQGMNINSF